MSYKICTKCKIEKDLSEFYKDKNREDGFFYICKKCMSKYFQKYYEKNKRKIIEQHRGYIKKNVEKTAEYLKEYQKEWNKNNKEYKKEYQKQWAKRNPEKILEKNRKRRAIKANVDGSFTENEFQEKLKLYNYKCCACGTDLKKTIIHRDHIQPLSKGGSDNIENIQPLCEHCNLTKKDKLIDFRDDWLQNYAI